MKQTDPAAILPAALDNLVRHSVTGCGRAARRAADHPERLSETQSSRRIKTCAESTAN